MEYEFNKSSKLVFKTFFAVVMSVAVFGCNVYMNLGIIVLAAAATLGAVLYTEKLV